MKKYVPLLIFLVFLPLVSSGTATSIKLRASRHPDFLRIVLEGDNSIIETGVVYQKGEDILVKFSNVPFSIQNEKIEVAFAKKDEDSVLFSPGAFRELKVYKLKHPDRLVMDVYQNDGRGPARSYSVPSAPPSSLPVGKKKKKISTVIIDPGHGGYDNGLVKGSYSEKNVVLDISRELDSIINKGSFKVFLTRGSDGFMTQRERAEFSNSRTPEIFVSIHISSRNNIVIYLPVITEDVSDVVKPYLINKGQKEHTQETIALLNAMKEAVTAEFGEDMVLVQPLPYSILSKVESASLMIELPSFDNVVYSEEVRTKMANTIYKGFNIYEESKTK